MREKRGVHMETIRERLRSKVVWAAVAAQVMAMLLTLGVVDTGLSETIEAIIAGVLQLLTVFGVLNNPADRAHF